MSPAYICNCNAVTEKEIKRVIVKWKIEDLKTLIIQSGAGASCGRCRPQVKSILEANTPEVNDLQIRIKWD